MNNFSKYLRLNQKHPSLTHLQHYTIITYKKQIHQHKYQKVSYYLKNFSYNLNMIMYK